MKRLILCLVLCLGFHIVNAQGALHFGVKGGANLASYAESNQFIDYPRKLGFYAGVFAETGITERFSIRGELLYAEQGSREIDKGVTFTDTNGNVIFSGDFESTLNETTLMMPILAKYSITENVFFELGPQFAYITDVSFSTSERVNDDSNTFLSEFASNRIQDVDSFDAGILIGAGYNISSKWSIAGRYFAGLVERDGYKKSSVFNLGADYVIF